MKKEYKDKFSELNFKHQNHHHFFLSEVNYNEEMKQVLEYNFRHEIKGTFQSYKDNLKISYAYYLHSNPKASIVIAHGYTEAKIKYNELIYYFLKSGFNVFIMDHRGHGESDRIVDIKGLVYVKSYEDYISDLLQYISTIVREHSKNKKVFLFGHSMGGGISTGLCEEFPYAVDGLILSSPMIHARLGMDDNLAQMITKTSLAFGKDKDFVFGNGPKLRENVDMEKANTHSYARANYFLNLKKQYEFNQLTGASYQWVKATLEYTDKIQKKDNIKALVTPTILFQAEEDNLVYPDWQNKVCKYAPNTNLIVVKGARHEIWGETNSILIPYFNTILDFINTLI